MLRRFFRWLHEVRAALFLDPDDQRYYEQHINRPE
jgi:hypothetical protein